MKKVTKMEDFDLSLVKTEPEDDCREPIVIGNIDFVDSRIIDFGQASKTASTAKSNDASNHQTQRYSFKIESTTDSISPSSRQNDSAEDEQQQQANKSQKKRNRKNSNPTKIAYRQDDEVTVRVNPPTEAVVNINTNFVNIVKAFVPDKNQRKRQRKKQTPSKVVELDDFGLSKISTSASDDEVNARVNVPNEEIVNTTPNSVDIEKPFVPDKNQRKRHSKKQTPNKVVERNDSEIFTSTVEVPCTDADALDVEKPSSHVCIMTANSTIKTFFQCEFCERYFRSQLGLKKHTYMHNNDWPHKCPICNRGFHDINIMMDHLGVHTGERRYKCSFCPKRFISKAVHKNHEKAHSGTRPHVCRYCGKTYVERSGLNKHLMTHTGERPHKCEVCQKDFAQKVHLQRHASVHSDFKAYQCDICEIGFTRSDRLRRHMKIHTKV